MTQRKSGAFRAPSGTPKKNLTDFPRPDSEQASKGAPEHEQVEDLPEGQPSNQNDDAHGYTQDSGYRSAGGYAAPERSDTAPAQVSATRTGNGHTATDQEIRAQIQQRMSNERAPRGTHLVVSVATGVVTLRGEVDDELERRRLTDLVRDVPAVRELRDELSTRYPRN